jgi:hypothetical protein
LENRWRREIESPHTDPNITCLIEPIKVFELTILFFQKEGFNSMANGAPSMTR